MPALEIRCRDTGAGATPRENRLGAERQGPARGGLDALEPRLDRHDARPSVASPTGDDATVSTDHIVQGTGYVPCKAGTKLTVWKNTKPHVVFITRFGSTWLYSRERLSHHMTYNTYPVRLGKRFYCTANISIG